MNFPTVSILLSVFISFSCKQNQKKPSAQNEIPNSGSIIPFPVYDSTYTEGIRQWLKDTSLSLSEIERLRQDPATDFNSYYRDTVSIDPDEEIVDWTHQQLFNTAYHFEKEDDSISLLGMLKYEQLKKTCFDRQGFYYTNAVIDDTSSEGNIYHVAISLKNYESSKHRRIISGNDDLIDGKPFYGVDHGGPDPKTEIASFEIVINHQKINLPPGTWQDLFNAMPCSISAMESLVNDYFYLSISGSDGAGAFDATWCFRNGKYERRILQYGW